MRIGFRPEHLLLTDSGDEARVTVVEPTGHELIVVFELHGNRIVGRLDPELRLKPDDVVRVAPRRDRIHVFAAADGMRGVTSRREARQNHEQKQRRLARAHARGDHTVR